MSEIADRLVCRSVNDFQAKMSAEDDEFKWDRFIRQLVIAGYGDYEAAANAEIVEAAVFLFLGSDADTRVNKWLNG